MNTGIIKLVIWDLDETFWKGTLSEEGIIIIPKNIDIVKELTNRGIMNSISSKNNFEDVKAKLIELDIWDYFIFPGISWNPKGLQVKNIISDCNLRDENALFIDDNHLNIEEVKFYNPNISTMFPDGIDSLLGHDALKGKDDTTHSRLKQYKILERKSVFKSKVNDNLEFLIKSDITVSIIENELNKYLDRIVELVERTNQLTVQNQWRMEYV